MGKWGIFVGIWLDWCESVVLFVMGVIVVFEWDIIVD